MALTCGNANMQVTAFLGVCPGGQSRAPLSFFPDHPKTGGRYNSTPRTITQKIAKKFRRI